jgi:LacI family transcriptional regulator
LADGRIDGALLLRDEGDPLISELEMRHLPCVQFFSRAAGDAPFVDADNYAGGRLATRHLIELGHRRIAMVRGPQRSNSSNDRYVGYRDALESAGIGVGPERVVSIPSPLSDPEPFRRLMQTPDRPSAVFCWSDEVALVLMPLLREMGLRVPEDVSLVGFDSLAACEQAVPALTSVRQPIFDMAAQATRLLAALVRQEAVAQRQILVPLALDRRHSTAPPGA